MIVKTIEKKILRIVHPPLSLMNLIVLKVFKVHMTKIMLQFRIQMFRGNRESNLQSILADLPCDSVTANMVAAMKLYARRDPVFETSMLCFS
jgi:hypothetical protein